MAITVYTQKTLNKNFFRDEKPANCDVVPQSACAVAYDSGTCSGIILDPKKIYFKPL